MNEAEWQESQATLRRLETMLPSLPPSSLDTDLSLYSSVTVEQRAMGRRAWIAMMLRRGWRLGDDGKLHKGEGREAVSCPANGMLMPFRQPWDPKYNPRIDAPAAAKFGATFIGPNRYRLGLLLMDANAALRDEENECPMCGCTPGQTYRVVRVEHPNPHVARQQPWVQAFRPCPRCAGNGGN